MAANYKKLKKQLEALKKFQDIASAIRFVAGGELGILRKEIKCRFLALSSISPFFNKQHYAQEFKTALVVPITDDRGSCGPHNTNVLIAANDLVLFLEDRDKSVLLYTIGKKARNMFKRFFKKYFAGFILNLKDTLFSIDVSSFIFDRISKIKYDRLYLTFNRYFSINMQKALSYIIGSPTDFLNLIMDKANQTEKASLFFQSVKNKFVFDSFFNDLFVFSHSLLLADALQDNRYSFLAGRFNGMDNTVRSTGDLIESLTIRYNKARQEHITTELIEIISCKEAITVTEEDEDISLLVQQDLFSGYDSTFSSYLTSNI